MFYAQELLRMQFPMIDGWQSTLLAQNNGFLPAKMDAIQIHIASDSHWVTSARLGGTVTLFDCRKAGSNLSSTLTHQLCKVYRTSICKMELFTLYINLGVLMNFTFTEYLYTMSCTNELLQLSRHQGQLSQLQITLLDTLWP